MFYSAAQNFLIETTKTQKRNLFFFEVSFACDNLISCLLPFSTASFLEFEFCNHIRSCQRKEQERDKYILVPPFCDPQQLKIEYLEWYKMIFNCQVSKFSFITFLCYYNKIKIYLKKDTCVTLSNEGFEFIHNNLSLSNNT